MGILDKGVDSADFDKFKTLINERLNNLEKKITATASESAVDAKTALNSANEYKTQIESLASEMATGVEEIRRATSTVEKNIQDLNAAHSECLENSKSLAEKSSEAIIIYQKLEQVDKSTQEIVQNVESDLEKVKDFLTQAEQIPEALELINSNISTANTQSENIKSLLSHSVRRKNELDELHKEVFGHEIEDAEGNTERVDGLRDELEKSYKSLSERLESLDEEAEQSIKNIEADQQKTREAQNEEFSELLKSGRIELDGVSEQLKALLPGALAAGLSAAYEKKKEEEAASLSSHERNFMTAVVGLVLVSLIPFSVNVYLLTHGATLATVLKDTPRMVTSILPLYFPVLWLAYSANKRLNLSKRLIEEYTHKAVLGKTFSGLSNQIETLPHESAVKEELRTRLLFNVLQVSAENPGKLITDYSKADHPLMDVLEKSARLSESVDALSKIPGLSLIAKKLASRRDVLLKEQERKIEQGLVANEHVETKEADNA